MAHRITPIITIDYSYTRDDIAFLTEKGIAHFRLNAARIGVDRCLVLHKVLLEVAADAHVYIDTAGTKERIYLKEKNRQLCDVVRIGWDTEFQADFYVSQTFFMGIEKDDVLVIRSELEICLVVESKINDIISARMISGTGKIRNRLHIFIRNRYIVNNVINQMDETIIDSFADKGWMCLSFCDSPELLNVAKSRYCGGRWLAKIESPTGVGNASGILRYCDGIIVGRDDLSAYYSPAETHSIALRIAELCESHDKFCIPASNYFLGLTKDGRLTDSESQYLSELKAARINYIYCNETVINKSRDVLVNVLTNCGW